MIQLHAIMKICAGKRGLTLIEMAIVLVIIGLLVSVGAALIGPLTKRAKLTETREIVKNAYESVLGFTISNKRLPNQLADLGIKSTDAYLNNLIYFKAYADTPPMYNLCTSVGTYLAINDQGINKTNVAFVLFSAGENRVNDTGTTSPFTIQVPGVSGYDDIVLYVDIDTLRQKVCNVLRIVTDSLATATEETAYPTTTLEATDGTTPYTWTITSGALPPGLALTPGTGAISGTPTIDGSYNFTIQATDSDNPQRTATKSLTITVNPNKPKITTEFLTYGTVGQSYPSSALSASGGLTSYSWTLAGGSNLPPGLSLSSAGVISGTPTGPGTFAFTATVTDGRSRVALKTLSIAVYPSGSSTSSSSSSSSSSSTTSTSSSSSSSSGGAAPTCTLSGSPGVIQSGQTCTLSWSVSNGPASGIFSLISGACTNFSNSTGGSCGTAALSSRTTFGLTVSTAGGTGNCSTTVYVGRAAYRVWNNTGARRDFNIDGACIRINNNGEITSTSAGRTLNTGESINSYSTSNGSCGGAVQGTIGYNAAALADVDNDGQVNFAGTDR
jgi:prepilin-type N-terminal cleavage/methylation domain-containing protein